ncbi:hypothetical protein [Candidatus Lokiarchaeum ossiferum]|uniref:hypothetical protein n=1 Tax=Candidatus Lokiarchaeum ossiferum TaxID=2951803 RepID=UPI00352E8DF8
MAQTSDENKASQKLKKEKKPILKSLTNLFKSKPKILPKIGGHLGITTEQLGWNEKTYAHWYKIFVKFATKSEKNDKEATLAFYREIQTNVLQNSQYIAFFWNEIWEGRLNPYPEVQKICYKFVYQFVDENLDYFMQHSETIFDELDNSNEERHKFGKYVCEITFKIKPEWHKKYFRKINQILTKQVDYLKITPFEHFDGKSPKKSKKKRKSKHKSKDAANQSQGISQSQLPPGFQCYFFLWVELIEKYPDLINQFWDDIQMWLTFYELFALKREKEQNDPNLAPIPKTLLEYQLDIILDWIHNLLYGENLPSDFQQPCDKIARELLTKLAQILISGSPSGKERYKEHILNIISVYIQKNPETLKDYPLVSTWLHQDQCPRFPAIIYELVFEMIIRSNNIALADTYFMDFLTHLSYGASLTIKKSLKMLYFLHNSFNYFNEAVRFGYLVSTLDQENPEIQEHTRYIIFTVVKKNPQLLEYIKGKMEQCLKSNSKEIHELGIFFLQTLNEVLLIHQGTEIVDFLFQQFESVLTQPYENHQVQYLMAHFFQILSKNHLYLIETYRSWFESLIDYYSFDFELKNIYSKIRMKIIRIEIKSTSKLESKDKEEET